jgi:hypothetical protein
MNGGIETLSGDEAVAHNNRIMDVVSKQLGGDETSLKEFKSATRSLGKGKVSCSEVRMHASSAGVTHLVHRQCNKPSNVIM